MDLEYLIKKEQVSAVVNKLFTYTDNRNWNGLLQEILAPKVFFDMSSLGAGEPAMMESEKILAGWEQGLQPVEAIHHQAGMYEIDIKNNEADVFCYGIAYHYKKHPSGNNTRVFVGSYNLHLLQSSQGWKIDKFKFNCKFVDGNLELT
jgi:hypothetical protein